MFECTKCGKCCENVYRNKLYQELDSGNGMCKYYDAKTKLCTIYASRPLLCNIDEYYNTYLTDKLTREEWYEMNHQGCKKIQNL